MHKVACSIEPMACHLF